MDNFGSNSFEMKSEIFLVALNRIYHGRLHHSKDNKKAVQTTEHLPIFKIFFKLLNLFFFVAVYKDESSFTFCS